jgi:hypothetical protein
LVVVGKKPAERQPVKAWKWTRAERFFAVQRHLPFIATLTPICSVR